MTLESLFNSILDIPLLDVTDELSQAAMLRWDSLMHINIVAAVEEVYGVSFTTSEILSLKSVGDFRISLRDKGVRI